MLTSLRDEGEGKRTVSVEMMGAKQASRSSAPAADQSR
jgi:hypothetical protein